MLSQKYVYALIGALMFGAAICNAQDYDDDGYGSQGNNNQNDGDSGYGNGNGYDDSYNNNNNPNYQVNVETDGGSNNPNNYSPQGAGGSDADGDYEGDDNSAAAAASSLVPSIVRVRRSVESEASELKASATDSTKPKLRVKRHGKHYIGPVYTYVKTDKHANFKWGVKHKVGKKHHG